MEYGRLSHANCCLLNCLSHADPSDVLKDEVCILVWMRRTVLLKFHQSYNFFGSGQLTLEALPTNFETFPQTM